MKRLMMVLVATAMLIIAGSASAQEQPQDDMTGHFTRQDQLQQLELDSYISDGSEMLRLYIAPVGDDTKRVEIIDLEELNGGYSHVWPLGVCHSPDTGLDIARFVREHDGTAWGDRKNILFVYYDSDQKQFVWAAYEGRFVDGSCSPASAKQHEEEARHSSSFAAGLYDSLRPPAAIGNRLQARDLEIDLNALANRMEMLNRSAEVATGDEDGPAIDQAYYNIEVLAENAAWRVTSIWFEERVDTSWGVVLAENRKQHRLFSFYDVPHEGSSKRYLFLPDNVELDGNILHLSLCTDCSWWGEYAPYQIDLETLEITQLSVP